MTNDHVAKERLRRGSGYLCLISVTASCLTFASAFLPTVLQAHQDHPKHVIEYSGSRDYGDVITKKLEGTNKELRDGLQNGDLSLDRFVELSLRDSHPWAKPVFLNSVRPQTPRPPDVIPKQIFDAQYNSQKPPAEPDSVINGMDLPEISNLAGQIRAGDFLKAITALERYTHVSPDLYGGARAMKRNTLAQVAFHPDSKKFYLNQDYAEIVENTPDFQRPQGSIALLEVLADRNNITNVMSQVNAQVNSQSNQSPDGSALLLMVLGIPGVLGARFVLKGAGKANTDPRAKDSQLVNSFIDTIVHEGRVHLQEQIARIPERFWPVLNQSPAILDALVPAMEIFAHRTGRSLNDQVMIERYAAKLRRNLAKLSDEERQVFNEILAALGIDISPYIRDTRQFV